MLDNSSRNSGNLNFGQRCQRRGSGGRVLAGNDTDFEGRRKPFEKMQKSTRSDFK